MAGLCYDTQHVEELGIDEHESLSGAKEEEVNTMSALKIKFITGIALVLSLSLGLIVGSTYAAEASAVNLTLKDTIIKTEDTSLPLPSGASPVTPGNAFSQSTINCPGRQRTCMVRVEISS